MKADECEFLLAVAAERPCPAETLLFATDVGEQLGIHHNRVVYLLEKWTHKGWWEYGVSLRSGWLTAAGVAFIKGLTTTPDSIPPTHL